MGRVNAAADLQRKMALLGQQIAGRENASSTTLSRSFGLTVEQVRKILNQKGVRDDG